MFFRFSPAVFLGAMIVSAGIISHASPAFPEIINIRDGANIQQIIDAAPTNSIIQFNPNEQLVFLHAAKNHETAHVARP
ncbi:MAG: hypothetical protein WDM76_18240 [Limisphaerales bacterium]